MHNQLRDVDLVGVVFFARILLDLKDAVAQHDRRDDLHEAHQELATYITPGGCEVSSILGPLL